MGYFISKALSYLESLYPIRNPPFHVDHPFFVGQVSNHYFRPLLTEALRAGYFISACYVRIPYPPRNPPFSLHRVDMSVLKQSACQMFRPSQCTPLITSRISGERIARVLRISLSLGYGEILRTKAQHKGGMAQR